MWHNLRKFAKYRKWIVKSFSKASALFHLHSGNFAMHRSIWIFQTKTNDTHHFEDGFSFVSIKFHESVENIFDDQSNIRINRDENPLYPLLKSHLKTPRAFIKFTYYTFELISFSLVHRGEKTPTKKCVVCFKFHNTVCQIITVESTIFIRQLIIVDH